MSRLGTGDWENGRPFGGVYAQPWYLLQNSELSCQSKWGKIIGDAIEGWKEDRGNEADTAQIHHM
ncbi:predicted protein [Sclerotinia sclerotiorum 1980 UF-70]|uniref:Uncharacterized protein n=1 Tax=Sclerotinia sclerotiorum (strain ATCC 18683 / 1980 / Ss-1) TaxID=665079 RepID=A7EI01_SCLS1|nr:predicted protein [Sclerotinia sclerotiorum 1980 UF-70]EDO02467.1 predicted protein [Sclerotinia sclerotiorum 1980 UF-70]